MADSSRSVPSAAAGAASRGGRSGAEADAARVVPSELGGGPLDAAVRALFELSWGRARDLVRRGKIRVDDRVVVSPTAPVRAGAKIAIDLTGRDPRAERAALPPSALVYVDAHVVVVDKPSGVSTIPYDPEGMGASISRRARHGEEVALDERVRVALARREKARGKKGAPAEIGVVHRLDKETSGLIVFTRTWAAKKALSQAFRFHHVHRRYLALVHGVPKNETIVSHFVEDRGDGLRGSVERRRGRAHAIGSEKTQRAVTHVEVLERSTDHARDDDLNPPWALVACRLETGRTHQIRIHLAEAGHPLLGERVYVRDYRRPIIPAPRVMLHAAELGFTHPATGREMRWTSELPPDMTEMLAFLRR